MRTRSEGRGGRCWARRRRNKAPAAGPVILVVDNYDSFTWNLVHYFGELGAEVVVRRNDALDVQAAIGMRPDGIVLSPGPCDPRQAGICLPLIGAAAEARIPLLGVCLGHQAIGEAYGGRVIRAERTMHGKTSAVAHDGSGIFEGLPSPLSVMRYHSLVVEPATLPGDLDVVARATDDVTEIHALRHREHPVWGVQFHPESILTQGGKQMLANFLELAR